MTALDDVKALGRMLPRKPKPPRLPKVKRPREVLSRPVNLRLTDALYVVVHLIAQKEHQPFSTAARHLILAGAKQWAEEHVNENE